MHEAAEAGISDKRKYMEGAVWMGKRMTTEIERVCQGFEGLSQEYMSRFKEVEKLIDSHKRQSRPDTKLELEVL